MTREEELIRIAKKLDKMVSRNNTVRLYFMAPTGGALSCHLVLCRRPVNVSAKT